MLQLLSKIKSAHEVRLLVGPRPRDKRVVMCHGVFDVVHPGHVRHLIYAKNTADILIASVTADRHVVKGVHRPHVPQDLRATNLAAYEMVDYVIIDDNAEPLENIRLIEPEFFAKGFEYVRTGGPHGAQEFAAVNSYGGEIIFTPGDVVYSSSKLIELAPPDIKFAKLHALMDRTGVTFTHLHRAVNAMKNYRVHVVGDTIVDTLTYCNLIGASGKTPTMSVAIERNENFVGGAAVVAKHVRAAGAQVIFSTVLGNDDCGKFVVDDLLACDIDLYHSVDLTRPTTNKNAVIAGGYRLLKLDTVDNRTITSPIINQLRDNLMENKSDAAVFSDFRHGLFNRATIPLLTSVVPGNALRAADSQVASRWGNILDFEGFDLITPNEREARFALGDQESGIRALAWDIHEKANCKCLILKLGERGTLTKAGEESFVVDSFADHVADPVGSGDALLAYATLALLSAKRDPMVATILGVFAAGVACERDGNIAVTADDVRNKIDRVERQMG